MASTRRRFRSSAAARCLLLAAALAVTLQLGTNLSNGPAYVAGETLDAHVGSYGVELNRKGRIDMPIDKLLMDVPESETLAIAEKFTRVEDIWEPPYNPWLTKNDFRTRLRAKFDALERKPSEAAFDVIFDSFNWASPQVDSPEKVENVIKSWRGPDGQIDKDGVARSVAMGKFYIMFSFVLYYTLTLVCPLTIAGIFIQTYVLPLIEDAGLTEALTRTTILPGFLFIFYRVMTR